MVGTGVFTTSGLLIADLGSAWLVLLAWVLGGLVALLGALCYGALARHIPNRAESTCSCRALFIQRLATWPAGFRCWWVLLSAGRAGFCLRAVHVRLGRRCFGSRA